MRNQAIQLRHNLTEAEKMLWTSLRAHRIGGVHFRRQHAIGEYIVDFCAPRKKLIIEIDGQSHTKSRKNDEERTAYLTTKGYRVIRFWNHEIIDNIENVLNHIERALKDH